MTSFHRGSGYCQDPLAGSPNPSTRQYLYVFENIAALEAFNATRVATGQLVFVEGYYERGDGGQGEFWFERGSTDTANAGTIVAPDSGGGRWHRLYSGAVNVRWFGARGDGTTDDTDAFQAALDTGAPVFVPDSGDAYQVGRITLNTSYQQMFGDAGRGGSRIDLTDEDVGVVVGNSSTQRVDIAFNDLSFTGLAGQTAFWSKYVRGLTFRNCKGTFDRFIDLGDEDNAGAPTYIFELYECELHHVLSPTLHFIRATNFQGQLNFTDTFVEGRRTAGLDGFYASDNIASRIDHLVVQGGYFSRFRDNWSFVDARLVNAYWSDHLSELALRNALRIEVTSATDKSVSNVGCEGVNLANSDFVGDGFSVFLKNNRVSANMASIMVNGLNAFLSSGDTSDGLIYLEAVAEDIGTVNLCNLTMKGEPTASGVSKVVHLVGPSARNVRVDNLLAIGVSGTPWGYGVYIGANNYVVSVGSVAGENTTVLVSDNSSRASVEPTSTRTKLDTADFGTVNAVTSTGVPITVVGAAADDEVTVTPREALPNGIVLWGRVTATNEVTVYATNASAGNIVVGAIDVRVTARGWR